MLQDDFKPVVIIKDNKTAFSFVRVQQFDNPQLIVDTYLLKLAYDNIEKLKEYLTQDHLPEMLLKAKKRLEFLLEKEKKKLIPW